MSESSNQVPALYGIDVQRGRIPGMSSQLMIGIREDIDIGSTPITVWEYNGGTDYTFTAAGGAEYYASSSSPNDTNFVRAIILYEDPTSGDWLEGDVLFQLNGQTPVLIPTPADLSGLPVRLQKATVITATSGSEGLEGTAYIYESDTVSAGVPDTSSKVRGMINPESNRVQTAIYTIPSNKTGYITASFANTVREGVVSAVTKLYLRTEGGVLISAGEVALNTDATSSVVYDYHYPIVAIPKIDVIGKVTEVTSNNTGIQAGFNILLEDN